VTSILPSTLRVRKETAMRRRLADTRSQRWLWALGCALPVLGLPALLWHGLRRRTAIPFIYGLTTQALAAFVLATVASSLWAPQVPLGAEEPQDDGRGGNGSTPLALVLAASTCFALGHRQGQEKAARDAATWLRLDG
jgi:hypothetical protein